MRNRILYRTAVWLEWSFTIASLSIAGIFTYLLFKTEGWMTFIIFLGAVLFSYLGSGIELLVIDARNKTEKKDWTSGIVVVSIGLLFCLCARHASDLLGIFCMAIAWPCMYIGAMKLENEMHVSQRKSGSLQKCN